MNNLSWLIYLAGASATLANFFYFITGVFGVLAVLAGIVGVVHMDETRDYRRLGSAFKAAMALFVCMAMAGIVASLMPNRQTVLLIAASEIGERVVTSERVQGVIDPSIELLQTWIQQQTQFIRREMQQSTRR